ncbi:MAG: hypothetical protein GXP29_04070 [Planctomycetes bacterium]|nr:hypothetical protein [Planctomycetota bacterium]
MRDQHDNTGNSKPVRRPPSRPNPTSQPQKGHSDSDALLFALFESASSGDDRALRELILSNPEFAERYHRADPCVADLRDALGEASLGTDAADLAFAAIAARIKAQLASGSLAQPEVASVGEESPEPAGILTDMTRQLSASQARDLFEKLAPMLVYTALKHLDLPSTLDEVDRVSACLCSDDAVARLRAADHVRDALVGEFALALGVDAVQGKMDRDQMVRLLEESGTMGDLAAMANCITLIKTQAG